MLLPMKCARPDTTAATASAPPEKGKALPASMGRPLDMKSWRMPRSRMVAGPVVAKVRRPGASRSAPSRSPRRCQGASVRTHTTKGVS
jgi:hypothetical protein